MASVGRRHSRLPNYGWKSRAWYSCPPRDFLGSGLRAAEHLGDVVQRIDETDRLMPCSQNRPMRCKRPYLVRTGGSYCSSKGKAQIRIAVGDGRAQALPTAQT